MEKLGTVTTTGDKAAVKVGKPVKTRYVLVWLTAMPMAPGDSYSAPGYKQAITDLKFTG
ncbi:protein kinase family protein [Streptomyces hirsutus]